jgi:signal transduction histidine kinase/ActR/RegA family two-component response regulator
MERVAAQIYAGPHARRILYGLIFCVITLAAGVTLALAWLGLALLMDAARSALLARLQPAGADRISFALDVVSSATLAAAPAILWFSHADASAPAAIALLALLLLDAGLSAKTSRLYTLLVCSPYVSLGLAMALERAEAFWGVVASGCAIAYAFGAALHHANRAKIAREQDAERVRQSNMRRASASSAVWEIDYERKTLSGADALSTLLGRPASYHDVAEAGCFATEADRALVRAAFAPGRRAAQRIALEHDAVRQDGSSMRVRHEGFLHAAPDGSSQRLACTSVLAAAANADLSEHAAAAFALQADILRKLGNELGHAPNAVAPARDLAAMLDVLSSQAFLIGDGVDELAHRRHAADQANLAKSQFLANMSHELRTPLNAILGYAELLKEEAEDRCDTTTGQDLERILVAARHLLSLLNEVLDLSKIEAGRMETVVDEFCPASLVREAIETVRPAATANGNVISVQAPTFDKAETDALKLRQCLCNLLANAAKFTSNGEIGVAVEQRQLHGVEQIVISVRDTGIGMSKEQVARLFRPFVQADNAIARRYGGTGLGLTITRQLAQLLGGDVSVVSAPEQGSTFTLHVPLRLADAAIVRGAAAIVDDLQGDEAAPLVLMIEDEPDARDLTARALTRAGFSVLGAGGGETGLTLARARLPALILLDVFLPDRSGWRVLQSLKQDPRTRDIPVVVLSVNEDRAQAISLGAAEHLVKPADREVLAATVMRYARRRAGAAPSVFPARAIAG